MAKVQNSPGITHLEIIALAIRAIDGDIEGWRERCNALPADQAMQMFDRATAELNGKLKALKTLYRIEAGTEYEGG